MAGSSARASDADTSCNTISQPKCTIELSTGINMAYLETGPKTGKPVILIHGLTDNSRSWSTTMDALAKENPELHILAVELRGHGASSMPAADACARTPEQCFRLSDFAGDILAFMDAKGIAKATLVGHSLGSFIVQELSLSHPEKVERAILLATAVRGVGNAVLRDYVMKEPVEGSWKTALEAKGKTYPADFYELTPLDADPNAQDWMAKNWVVDPVADPAFLVPYLPETASVKLGTWIGASRALLVTDNTARLKSLTVPTLVLWAPQDNIFPPAPDQADIKTALAEAAKAKGTKIIIKQYGLRPLPASGMQEDDIGHNIQWGAPAEVAKDINAYVTTGEPLNGLPRSDYPGKLTHIVVDEGQGKIERFP